MTLHAFDIATNESLKWVAVPLEFVDWMAANFSGVFIHHLRNIDPYDSVLVPKEVTTDAVSEMLEVREKLRTDPSADVPEAVDLYGTYGIAGGLDTAKQMVEFFEFASSNGCKIVSVGD